MDRWRCPVLFGLLLVLCSSSDGANYPAECCKMGYFDGLNALSKTVRCEPEPSVLKAFKGVTMNLCRGFYRQCCTTTAKNLHCQMGQQLANLDEKCAKSNKPNGGKQKMCCDCCNMGKKQAELGGSCERKDSGQVYCNSAYEACCMAAKGIVPTDKPDPGQGTIGTNKQKTCADMRCDSASTTMCMQDGNDEPYCKCKPGFRPNNNDVKCVDIDECATGTHNCPADKVCRNTIGGYVCDTNSTPTKAPPTQPPRTERPSGCKKGFILQGGDCVDENECQVKPFRCGQYNYCMNQPGTYQCVRNCPNPNYKIEEANECTDVDECADPKACPVNFSCENQVGSFKCIRQKCGSGYRMLANKMCQDINECIENPTICGDGGTCYNSHGTYHCACKNGYQLDTVTKRCMDVNECKENNAYCAHRCDNTLGSYNCRCPAGFESFGSYCNDKDECSQSPCGGDKSYCFNTFGAYECLNQTCPGKYFVKSAYNECKKIDCLGDKMCYAVPEESYKWVAYKFHKDVKPDSFIFSYWTRFSADFTVTYKFASGNDEGIFVIDMQGRDRIKIRNQKAITGPKKITLVMNTDVLKGGMVHYRYVYTFYVFIGKYNFG